MRSRSKNGAKWSALVLSKSKGAGFALRFTNREDERKRLSNEDSNHPPFTGQRNLVAETDHTNSARRVTFEFGPPSV